MRTVGSNGAKTAATIRKAATRLIYEHGFEAMSLRQLAADVGLQPGSLYNYFTTKQALLVDIINDHMDDVLRMVGEALGDSTDPRERLSRFAAFHIRYHLNIREQLYVATTELRSLAPENRPQIVKKRKEYSDILVKIISDGIEAGLFFKQEPQITAFAILGMLTAISSWYNPDGKYSQQKIIETYLKIVFRAVVEGEVGNAKFLTGLPVDEAQPRRARRSRGPVTAASQHGRQN